MPQQWPCWLLLFGPLILALMAAQLWMSGRVDLPTALVFAATDALPWFAALPGVLWLANRFSIEGSAAWRNAVVHVLAGLTLALMLPLAALGLMRTMDLGPAGGPFLPAPNHPMRPLPDEAMHPPPPMGEGGDPNAFPPPRAGDAHRWMPGGRHPEGGRPSLLRMAARRAPVHWLLYALVLTAIHGWRATQRSHARERREAELECQLVEARLTGLTRQLHPHFLFNTLNTIVEFVRSNPPQAEEMLLDLSELLRHALRASDKHVVPLAEELELLDRYLAIQRARFGERMRVERRIAPQSMAAEVPVLLLQPLVENALIHGLDQSDVPVTITIEAELAGERLRLAVRDDAPGASDESKGEGIGLANTRQRLATLYGDDFSFSAGPRAGGGFSVDFVLPSRTPSVSTGLT